MKPIEVLTKEDKETIKDWIEHSCGSAPSVSIDYLLREWNEEKEELFHLFGDKLKLSFNVERDGKQFNYFKLEREPFGCLPVCTRFLASIMGERRFFQTHIDTMAKEGLYDRLPIFKMFNKLSELFFAGELSIEQYNCIARLTDAEVLYSNGYDGDSFILTYSKKPGKKCQIPHGIKPMRALQKIFKFYHMPEDGYNEELEYVQEFRDTVSYQKAACDNSSEIILSIHPLDLLTVSDNNSGWSTCLSLENNGIYSYGITEILNSNALCVAYIRSDDKDFFNGRIDNKVFRNLVTITKDILAIGKSYPFHDKQLDQLLLKAISNRFNLEYDHNVVTYEGFTLELNSETSDILVEDIETNTPEYLFGGADVPYILTNNLFNDYIADAGYYTYWCSYNRQTEDKFINISGKSMCLHCGKFQKQDIDLKTLSCGECN